MNIHLHSLLQKSSNNFSYYITINTVLSLAQRAYEIFENSEVAEKRQLLNFTLRNLTLDGKKLQYKLKAPFDTVLLASKCSLGLKYRDSFRAFNWLKACPDYGLIEGLLKLA